MVMMPYNKGKKTFIRFMISYTIILCFTLLLGIVTYRETISMNKQNAINNGLLVLENGKNNLDNRFMEIEGLIAQITLQSQIRSLYKIKDTVQARDHYTFIETSQQLSSYTVTNSFVDDIFILLRDSEVFISSRYISNQAQFFYEYFLQYQQMSYGQWYDILFNQYHSKDIWPSTEVIQNKKGMATVTYVQTIPLSNYTGYRGVVLALINEEKLHETLNFIDLAYGGSLFVVDQNGRLITSIDTLKNSSDFVYTDFMGAEGFIEKAIGDMNYVIMYTTSNYLGWTYIAALPTIAFEQKAEYIKSVFMNIIIATFFVGFLVALYLSYHNSRPISRLIHYVKRLGNQINEDDNEYNIIEGTISDLVSKNTEMETKLKTQLPFLKLMFFERLMRGGFNQLKEIDTAMRASEVDITSDFYRVVLIQVVRVNASRSKLDTSELEVAKLTISQMISKQFPGVYTHNVDKDKTAVFMIDSHYDDSASKQIENGFETILYHLQNQYSILIAVGIGNPCSNLLGIRDSYEEALKALEQQAVSADRRIFWFHDLPKTLQGYYYPLGLELRLSSLVKSGDEEEAYGIIDMLYQKNFLENGLSHDALIQFTNEIIGTITKIKMDFIEDSLKNKEEMDTLEKALYVCHSGTEFKCILKDLIHMLCLVTNETKNQTTNKIMSSITDYIQAHFTDSGICLSDVASRFKMTEKYLSHYFKEHKGETFSSYIENLRMHKVLELLSHSNMTILEAAKKTGYLNNNTFYKAFKRIYGVSPGGYMKSLQQSTRESK